MPTIFKMNPRLADMIAAGEVVDRPSSVLKELIENAIDAHATHIDIDIKGIGMSFLSVLDNGIGMDKIDAKRAFERHATSKIKQESDLSHIHTLGFRGEALAAISAVSKVTLSTKTKEMKEAIQLELHAGHLISEQTVARNIGTTLTVSELFYNTPARFKYIKSEQAERYQIIDTFDHLALANPLVSLKLVIDDKIVKETMGNGDIKQLIDAVYGSSITKNMTIFEQEVQKIKIKGYLINPKITRSRKKDIAIFINKRYIRNYKLTQAVIDGYHSFLMVGKYPIAMIHLEIDPSLLDVNVHPQKLEVRLINESLLSFHVEKLIQEALTGKPQAIREPLPDIGKWQETYSAQSLFLSEAFEPEDNDMAKLPYLAYVGVYAGTYLLFQNDTGLYMMDQHAAAERVRYEHYYEALAKPVFAVKKRLIPLTLELSDKDVQIIHDHQSMFESYGFIFDQDQLSGHPTWLREEEIDIAIEEMVSMIDEHGTIDLKKLRDRLSKDVSCKGAIKANKALSPIEIDHLVEQLALCNNPYSCPHGRPTIIKLSLSDIEKMFRRIV